MKKIIACMGTVFTAAVLIVSTFTHPESVQNPVDLAEASEITKYTIEDIKNLQDFLLVRDTPDLSDKDYDLNNDERWDVFDLCLMKQQFAKQSSSESKVLIAYFTRAENVYLDNPDEIDIDATTSKCAASGKCRNYGESYTISCWRRFVFHCCRSPVSQ
ncbi:MAG: hypothetical protein Q4D37_07865 [Oscillospiraceae bacterium]|nr:hypothetical protein [Oscillospiraceae bacterium]